MTADDEVMKRLHVRGAKAHIATGGFGELLLGVAELAEGGHELRDLLDVGGVLERLLGRVAEDVRVAPLHLRDEGAGHVVHVPGRLLLLAHARVEEDLEEQVAELVGQRPGAVAGGVVDHLEHLVGLLEEVAGERGVGLPVGPGVAARRPQRLHHFHGPQQGAAARGGVGRDGALRGAHGGEATSSPAPTPPPPARRARRSVRPRRARARAAPRAPTREARGRAARCRRSGRSSGGARAPGAGPA